MVFLQCVSACASSNDLPAWLHSHTGYICAPSLRCVQVNVFSGHASERRQTRTGCTEKVFLHCVLHMPHEVSFIVKCIPTLETFVKPFFAVHFHMSLQFRQCYSLVKAFTAFKYFSPPCRFMCAFKAPTTEDAKLHNVHLQGLSPLCFLIWITILVWVMDA